MQVQYTCLSATLECKTTVDDKNYFYLLGWYCPGATKTAQNPATPILFVSILKASLGPSPDLTLDVIPIYGGVADINLMNYHSKKEKNILIRCSAFFLNWQCVLALIHLSMLDTYLILACLAFLLIILKATNGKAYNAPWCASVRRWPFWWTCNTLRYSVATFRTGAFSFHLLFLWTSVFRRCHGFSLIFTNHTWQLRLFIAFWSLAPQSPQRV